MVSPSLGLHSSKASVLERSFQTSERLWDDCIQEETRREALGGPQEDGDVENLALASQARKGKGKVRMNTGGDSSSQAGTGKDLSKVKCFHCHKKGHYASQCPERKKGGNRMQPEVAASTRAQADEFAKKFEQTKFLLVSQTSLGTISVGAWLIDSGATCHMTGARELFESFTESDSDVHVELGMGTKHAVKGSGIVPFQMESGGMLRVMDVLWVPELRRSVLSVSTIEKKGFDVLFQDGQALIKPRGSSSDTTTVLGVRESNLYRLKGQPMRAMASNRVAENKEQVAPKVEQLRGSQPSGSGGKEQPSKSVKKSHGTR
jgi:hypothetical protein